MNARDLTIHFAKEWEQRYKAKYAIAWTKHPAMFKRVLETHPPATLAGLITHYLSDFRSEFADKAGHSIEVFITSLPALVASTSKKEQAKPVVNKDFERLQAARGASTSEDSK